MEHRIDKTEQTLNFSIRCLPFAKLICRLCYRMGIIRSFRQILPRLCIVKINVHDLIILITFYFIVKILLLFEMHLTDIDFLELDVWRRPRN